VKVSKPTPTVVSAEATGAAAQATAPVRAMQRKARSLNWL
jgi:ribosomal protein S7